MKVQLEFITPNAEEFIGRMAAICYDSKTGKETCVKRAAGCVDKGHLATLRFASAVFNISGISRACSHQFVRSKHLDFLQRSQRYCDEADTTFYYPGTSEDYLLSTAYEKAVSAYKELRERGVSKENARLVLPAAATTELNVVGNFQAWKDFIELRSHKAAQEEIRLVALEIKRQLAAHCPNIYGKL